MNYTNIWPTKHISMTTVSLRTSARRYSPGLGKIIFPTLKFWTSSNLQVGPRTTRHAGSTEPTSYFNANTRVQVPNLTPLYTKKHATRPKS